MTARTTIAGWLQVVSGPKPVVEIAPEAQVSASQNERGSPSSQRMPTM